MNELPSYKKEDTPGGNLIRRSEKKDRESMVSVAESELLRILKHLEGKESDDFTLASILSLNVGKNKDKYKQLMKNKGILKIAQHECCIERKYNMSKKEIEPVKNGKITHRRDKTVAPYKSMLTAAGHSRTRKSLFIRTDIAGKLNQILLCGIPYNIKYDRPAKWNAYYAMCTTDSIPMKEVPHIIVIDDFEKYVEERVDEVVESKVGGKKKYKVNNDETKPVKIKPFDGAGLVTPQCAARWANDLGLKYIPAAFQFRAIPGIKGELFVADIYDFMKMFDVYLVKDIWGKEWNLREDKIDCILTKSQFKFHDLYQSFEQWQKEFRKELYGYKRTFNISSYAEHLDDLKTESMISYQPLLTVRFTDEQIERLTKRGIELFTNISTNLDEFMRYRGLTGEEDERVPSYYRALKKCPELFNDKYVYGKIEDDIQKLKNNLLAGKIITAGNYQTLTPDIYGLMQYAFNLEVTGLLKSGQIYSKYWNLKKIKSVDIIRNPHVTMEHRIGTLCESDDMNRWYRYQTTGILTSMYDTYLLALGGADTDGDHVLTVNDADIIDAVRRAIQHGHGRTVVFKPENSTTIPRTVKVNDTVALMKVNQDSFANDIGGVINEISKLWSMELTDDVRDYIKICSCIGSLVIDFAKTGEPAAIPDEIKNKLKNVKKPYFMRYLPQNLVAANKEKTAIAKAKNKYDMTEENIKKLYKFEKAGTGNVDRICSHMEYEIGHLGNLNIQMNKEFNFERLLHHVVPVNQKVKKRIYDLQKIYETLGKEKSLVNYSGRDLEKEYASRYRYFYEYCKSELLCMGVPVNDLIDMLLIIFYTDKNFVSESKSKDILWNVFGDELVQRCGNDYSIDEEKIAALQRRRSKNSAIYRKNVLKKMNKKHVNIDELDEKEDSTIRITKGDRQVVNEKFGTHLGITKKIRKTHKIDARRLFMVLVMIQRKTGSDRITKFYNKPNAITDLTLSKLADIDRRKVDFLLNWCKDQQLIDLEIKSNGNVVIKMKFENHYGDLWIQESDYNKICSSIRDYFRK